MQVNQPSARLHHVDPRLYLTDEELDRGAALILAAERVLSAAQAAARAASDLNGPEAEALLAIRAEPGVTVKALRDRLAATTPTLARTLGALDRRGYIERRKSAGDGRQRRLRLTPSGEAAVAPLAEAMRKTLRAAYREAGAEDVSGAQNVLSALTTRSE